MITGADVLEAEMLVISYMSRGDIYLLIARLPGVRARIVEQHGAESLAALFGSNVNAAYPGREILPAYVIVCDEPGTADYLVVLFEQIVSRQEGLGYQAV
jgi:hypothetical protein